MKKVGRSGDREGKRGGGAHQWMKLWGTEPKNSAGNGYSRDPMCWGAESWGQSTRCAVGSGDRFSLTCPRQLQ